MKSRLYFRIFVLFQEYCHEATVEVKWYWIWWWLCFSPVFIQTIAAYFQFNFTEMIPTLPDLLDINIAYTHQSWRWGLHAERCEGFILFHTYYTNVHIKEFWERILTYTRAHNLSIVLFACPALPANSIADMQAMIDNAHRRDLQALSSCRRCQLAIFHTNIDGEFKEVFSTSAKIFNESDWQL